MDGIPQTFDSAIKMFFRPRDILPATVKKAKPIKQLQSIIGMDDSVI
jgi:hypothetical protein